LKTTQARQNIYADKNRMHKEFKVHQHLYLKVKPQKSSPKIGPRYCEPFEILERIGPMAYKLAFLANIKINNVFHVSILKKYVHDFKHVIDCDIVMVES
jgi:hypothetical protein